VCSAKCSHFQYSDRNYTYANEYTCPNLDHDSYNYAYDHAYDHANNDAFRPRKRIYFGWHNPV
jgi:hypothetical protein